KPSRTCLRFDHTQKSFGGSPIPACQLVMSALACQKRPSAACTGTVEWTSVLMFAVSIFVVTMPHRSTPGFLLQNGVDNADGIDDARIIAGSKSKSDQSKRVRTHNRCCIGHLIRCAIFNRNKTVVRR